MFCMYFENDTPFQGRLSMKIQLLKNIIHSIVCFLTKMVQFYEEFTEMSSF